MPVIILYCPSGLFFCEPLLVYTSMKRRELVENLSKHEYWSTIRERIVHLPPHGNDINRIKHVDHVVHESHFVISFGAQK
jgi:hypothetical protein